MAVVDVSPPQAPEPDRLAVACNYAEGTAAVAEGALAFVWLTNPGGGNDRIQVLARSRGGRWIRKWEDMRRLTNFRRKNLPPEHPLWSRLLDLTDEQLAGLRAASDRLTR